MGEYVKRPGGVARPVAAVELGAPCRGTSSSSAFVASKRGAVRLGVVGFCPAPVTGRQEAAVTAADGDRR